MLPEGASESRAQRVEPPSRIWFLLETVTLPLGKIPASGTISAKTWASARYTMIEASVREVGIIEPLVVCPPMDKSGKHPKPDSRPEQLAKAETELRAIERDFVVLDQTYSQDALNLQLAWVYLKTLLANVRVKKYLGQKHAELLGELEKIVEVSSLEG